MSSFIKKGKRADTHKKVKKHKKQMYKVLHELKVLSEEIIDEYPNIDFNSKKAVQKVAKEKVGRELDSLEIIILINNIRNTKLNGKG